MKKIMNCLPFLALFLMPLLLYPVVDASQWRSSGDVHALFEFASSLLAITAAIMVLLHFFTTGIKSYLIISIGLVLIGTEEFVHSLFSFNHFTGEIAPSVKLAISTTWLTGNLILALSFFVAVLFGNGGIAAERRGRFAVVYSISGFIIAASLTLFIFNFPFLPRFVQLGSMSKKLIELSLAILFFAAFAVYFNHYIKLHFRSPLIWSIGAFIIFRVLVHIFVFDARTFYDSHWDSAHLLVFLSYFFPIFGIWGETIQFHRSAQAQLIELEKEMSERKKAQQALQRSETVLKEAQRLGKMGNWELDLQTGKLAWSDEVFRIFEIEPSRFAASYEAFLAAIHPQDRDAVDTAYTQSLTTRLPYGITHRLLLSGGRIRYVHEQCETQFDTEGKPLRSLGTVHDITELRRAEDSLADEKERLSVTLRSIGDGVITTDTQGNIVIMNKVAEELTGWKQDEAQGKPLDSVFTIIDENTRNPRENPIEKVLASGKTIELSNHTVLISRDGTERSIADSGAPIKDKNNVIIGVVLVFRDMTEKRRLLETAYNVQKLESLGVLAGGIAHDFNNLLGGIFGYIDLANMESDKSGISSYLSKAMTTIERARALTGQLLTFAKGGAPVLKRGHLFPFVQETAEFALSGSNVSCRFSVPHDLWVCNFDRNQIGQVIDNIIINAQQAMPVGGTIELTARNIVIAAKEHPVLANGNYIKISIKDCGIGIPQNLITRVFDPFFTTKTKGHGLGLATCYSIVNRHEGCIDVESEHGKGATFHIYLPASAESVSGITVTPDVKHKGSGIIMVMDDEEIIRDTVGHMLKSLGYTVVGKKNGREALDFYIQQTNEQRAVAGIILDLTVPGGLGGKDIIADIRALNPEIPVFVSSGYADDPIIVNPVEYGFTASLCKPFTISELSKILEKYGKTA